MLGLCLLMSAPASAQKKAAKPAQKEILTEGKATYTVGENEAITLGEARETCINLARANAINNVFGDRIMVGEEVLNDNYFQRLLVDNRADWLRDVTKPRVTATYVDGVLTFTAVVKGMIRETPSASIDVRYKVFTTGGHETTSFNDSDRFYLNFSSPADGYIIVYLIDYDDDEAALLLPEDGSADGYSVKRNKEYSFFDGVDKGLRLRTDRQVAHNQLVIAFSKNPIPPCAAIRDSKGSIEKTTVETFNNWLYNCQLRDTDMKVVRETITIQNKNIKKKQL